MPKYEYRRLARNLTFEATHGMNAAPRRKLRIVPGTYAMDIRGSGGK